MTSEQTEIRDRLLAHLAQDPGDHADLETSMNWKYDGERLKRRLARSYDSANPVETYALFTASAGVEVAKLEGYYKSLQEQIRAHVGEEIVIVTEGYGSLGHDWVRGEIGGYSYSMYNLGIIREPDLKLTFKQYDFATFAMLSVVTNGYARLDPDFFRLLYGGRLAYFADNMLVPEVGAQRAIGTDEVAVWKAKFEHGYQDLARVLTQKHV